jgi:bifunctional DNase/RNase
MIEMEVIAVQPEPNSNHPLVWLKDKAQRVFLPIAIGNFEATAIFMELYNEPPPRPITYDLLRAILEGFDVHVDQIVINALKDDTFFAEVKLSCSGRVVSIDSRPSDAIALALRVGAPIFVTDDVIREAGLPVEAPPENFATVQKLDQGKTLSVYVETIKNPEAPFEQRVIDLKAQLQEAVAQEEYEEAARLRDEIGRIEHDIQNR